jgi:translation elongation factor EF-Tu-like GTPase
VYDHYRPSFSFGSVNHFSGEVSFPDQDELFPGGTATAMIKLLPSRNIRQNLKSGDSFTILDGDKIIGTGVIQEIMEEHQIPVIH